MQTVRQLLDRKGSAIWSVPPEATVYEALKLMADKDVGSLLVMEADNLVGIISERDYARKLILRGKSSLETPVREVMTELVVTVHPGQTIEECMALMAARRIRHLPVLAEDRVVGVISVRDVVEASLKDKDLLIQQLEKYVSGLLGVIAGNRPR